jgi:hypothetical protein
MDGWALHAQDKYKKTLYSTHINIFQIILYLPFWDVIMATTTDNNDYITLNVPAGNLLKRCHLKEHCNSNQIHSIFVMTGIKRDGRGNRKITMIDLRMMLRYFAQGISERKINEKKTEMYLKTSKLRYNAVLEDIVCSVEHNFTKEMLIALSDCGFVGRAENLLIEGKCGVGKSYLACSLGRQACFMGYRVEYFSMYRFIDNAFRDGFIQTTGTALGKVQPPVSRFTPNGERSKKRETVLEKPAAYFKKFWDISGGKLFR